MRRDNKRQSQCPKCDGFKDEDLALCDKCYEKGEFMPYRDNLSRHHEETITKAVVGEFQAPHGTTVEEAEKHNAETFRSGDTTEIEKWVKK